MIMTITPHCKHCKYCIGKNGKYWECDEYWVCEGGSLRHEKLTEDLIAITKCSYFEEYVTMDKWSLDEILGLS